MRILVTGGTGFIGCHTLPLLVRAGHEVHSAHRRRPPDIAGVQWHEVDLLEPGSARVLAENVRADVLLHLAWFAEPGKFWASPLNFPWVRATLDLVESFREAGGSRAVVAGTSAEYDDHFEICTEFATPLAPKTVYGTCKRAVGDVLGAYADVTGMQLAWGRVFLLYGPHEHPQRFVASVVSSLLSGTPAAMSHGEQVRDFLHVYDVARAFATLVDSAVVGPVNIASGAPVTLRHVAELIAAQISDGSQLHFGALPARPGEPPLFYADATRLRKEVGWTPEFDLASGLLDTISWWRSHLGIT